MRKIWLHRWYVGWALKMHSPGGTEKKLCQAEEIARAKAQDIVCPYSHQGLVASHGLFSHCVLYPPADMAQQNASEKPRIPAPYPHSSLCAFILLCLAWPRSTWSLRPWGESTFSPLKREKTRPKRGENKRGWGRGPWATDSLSLPIILCHTFNLLTCRSQ